MIRPVSALARLRAAETTLERVVAFRDDGVAYLPLLRRVQAEIAACASNEDTVEALRRKLGRAA